MSEAIAKFRLWGVLITAVLWIVAVSLLPWTANFPSQASFAVLATAAIVFDEGVGEAVVLVRSMVWFLALMLAVSGAAMWLGVARENTLLVPLYFYSTFFGLRWLTRRIAMEDVLCALPRGKSRLVGGVLRGAFTTGSYDYARLLWYCEMYERGTVGWKFPGVRSKFATILAAAVWLMNEVPIKVAMVENRALHLEGTE